MIRIAAEAARTAIHNPHIHGKVMSENRLRNSVLKAMITPSMIEDIRNASRQPRTDPFLSARIRTHRQTNGNIPGMKINSKSVLYMPL